MIRFLGPTGRRLHRALPGATLSAVLLTLLVAVPAWAANPGVQNTGAFQLDGNAQQSVPASTPGDDWDNICASNPSTCTFQTGFSASASTTTTASAHISDTAINVNCAGRINCTVFTGGGSKDPQNIPSWNWKTDSGGLPAKDNLAHSFAARYAVASTGTGDANCPAPTAGTDTCKVLYFGSDRIVRQKPLIDHHPVEGRRPSTSTSGWHRVATSALTCSLLAEARARPATERRRHRFRTRSAAS